MKKNLVGLIFALSIAFLSGCSKNTVGEEIANLVNSTNEYVQTVKSGTSFSYPDVTFEEAFHYFFDSPTWKYFNGTQDGPDEDGDGEPDYYIDNVNVVEFTGFCLYSDVEVKALIQFVVEEDTFEAKYLSFNDVPQNMLMLSGLITKAFESYLDSKIVPTTVPTPVQSEDIVKENSSMSGETLIFTQVGLYDHNAYAYLAEEYIPKIYLYGDGTFEFVCNFYEEMETLSGWWRVEEEVPKTYHCYVENVEGLMNLDFYLYQNEALCDAEFYSDYSEFGMTSFEEVLFHCGPIDYDAFTEDEYDYGNTEIYDTVEFKMAAADNAETMDYKDFLRNPEWYSGVPIYICGTVSNKNGSSYLVTNSKGENYWIYADSSCANVINDDKCTVFGTITGADASGTLVYVIAQYVLVGNEQNLSQESREKERIYDVYTEDGEAFYTLTESELIRERYYIFRDAYELKFEDKIISNGIEGYRIVLSFDSDSDHYNLKGFYEPWERSITWDWILGQKTSNTDFGIWWIGVSEEKREEKMLKYSTAPTPTEIPMDMSDTENNYDEWLDESLFCGYDYNGAELYVGYLVRIGADAYNERYVVGTIVDVDDEGIIVEFTEIYYIDEYGPYDYYYLEGVIDEINEYGSSSWILTPDSVQIHIYG